MAKGKTPEYLSQELLHLSSIPPNMPTYGAAACAKANINGDDDLDDFVPVPFSFTPKLLRLGRRLAHLPESSRTRAWLRMLFEHGNNEEIETS